SAWQALGSGLDGDVLAFAVLPNGNLVAGGRFQQAGGTSASFIASWNGTGWQPLGSGLTPNPATAFSPGVLALLVLPNGDLIAGGEFDFAGGAPAANIATWNGTAWHAMGTTLTVKAITTTTIGDIVTTGESGTQRWTGGSWQYLFPGGAAITRMPGGDLLVGGDPQTQTQTAGFELNRWNGITWTPLPFTWSLDVRALQSLPNGDLLVGGRFPSLGSPAASNLARWNGAWSPAGGGGTDGTVFAFLALPDGDILAGGDFHHVGVVLSDCVARLSTTCPAAPPPQGTGCTGSGGANILTATSLPWIGATITTTATGMPTTGLAAGVLGVSTLSIPLSSIFRQGAPGCSLFVDARQVDLHVPSSGRIATSFAVPNSVVLANQTLYQQVLAIDLGPLGAIAALTSTNALSLTIGAL